MLNWSPHSRSNTTPPIAQRRTGSRSGPPFGANGPPWHVSKVPKAEITVSFDLLRGGFGKISGLIRNNSAAPAFVLATHPRPQKESSGVELQCPGHLPQ
jgi:hypothetical protein